jgi:EmrB/QacA subfamily drug resistance transporter
MSGSLLHSNSRRWWVLAVMSVTSLMISLDATVINIALPRAQADLHFSSANRQWLITAYALAFGSLLLLGGRLGDHWGRKKALYLGLIGFAAASAVGGAANSFNVLVTARAAQGVFGALLAPAALASVMSAFTNPKERAKAFAIFSAISASGAAIGLLLGGALTEWQSWRWCLFINLFFAAIGIIGVALYVEGSKRENNERLDYLGTLLGSAGLFFVVFGLGHAVTTSWSNSATWGSLVLGLALLAIFIFWQEKAKNPLLPLRILTSRTRGGSATAIFITSVGVFGVFLFLSYYLEGTLHYSPLRTGFAFMPLVIAILISSALASARLLPMIGPRPLVPSGMLLSMLGMILFTKLTAEPDYLGHVLPGLIVTGLGLGMIFAPATASATAGVEDKDAGASSAFLNTLQQIGGSVGTALLNTIAVSVTLRAAETVKNPAEIVQATLHGYAVAFWWSAGFFGVGALLVLIILDSGVPEFEEENVSLN